MLSCIKDFLLGKYTWTFMYSVQTIRLQVEYVLSLFSVAHCTVRNLLTFLDKEEEMDLFIRYELVSCDFKLKISCMNL